MKLGYTIIYVSNVPETVAFYRDAFGLTERFMHKSKLYAEMDTGETVLSFSAEEAVELDGLAFAPNERRGAPAGWELCFVTAEVTKAYEKALAQGCTAVRTPHEVPWGQTIAYVRDLNGCLVEIATPMPEKISGG